MIITHCEPNVAPSCRIVIREVQELVIAHHITRGSDMANVRQPKSDDIVSDYLWFRGGVKNCNADHSQKEVDITQSTTISEVRNWNLAGFPQDSIMYRSLDTPSLKTVLIIVWKRNLCLLQSQHASIV
jgi:hypothetical protein